MTFTIQNGSLTLAKSDPGLEPLALFFDVLLASDTFVISAAQQGQAANNQVTISGRTAALGGMSQAELTYTADSGALTQLKIVQPLIEFAGLAVPGIVSFSNLEHHLLISAPDPGSTEFAQLWRELSGDLHLGTGVIIPFTIANPVASQTLLIEAAFAPGSAPGLADLASLLGVGPEQDLSWLPDDLRDTRLLTLRELAFKIDPAEAIPLSMVRLTIDLAQGHLWPIIPGSNFLSIGNLWLSIEVDYPLEPEYRFPVVQFGGSIKIGQAANDGAINVAARWPDFAVSGRLAEGQAIRLGQLLDELALPLADLPTGNDELMIERLSFSAEPTMTPQRYTFSIDIANLWSLPLPKDRTLSIAELSLLLDYTGPASTASSTTIVMLLGKLNIAGVELTLGANHYRSNSGWQFAGSTGAGQAIPIGVLIADLAAKFGATTLPGALEGLTIQNLSVTFNTATKDFTFAGEAMFSVASADVAMRLTIDITHAVGDYTKAFGGQITVGGLVFDLHFVQNKTSDLFVATYSHVGAIQSIKVRDLIAYLSADIAADIPNSLTIELKDVILAFRKQGDATVFLFGLDLGASINLSQLPLVGQVFAPDQTLAVEDLQILVASQDLKLDDVAAFNALFPAGVTRLPTPPAPASGAALAPAAPAPPAIARGLTLAAVLRMGGTPTPLMLPISSDAAASAPSSSTAIAVANPNSASSGATAIADNTRWFAIQRAFGPVYFGRIGVQYKDAAVWFHLDATLAAGGLTLALDGLAVGSPLDHFAPTFTLRGLAVAYQSDALTIAGALLRVPHMGSDGVPYDEYDGAALLKTPKLTLAALGSYAYLNGYPSLFVYATLDAPIGGPAFFFVTGLAAGFGYNRALRSPALDQIAQFPLIQAAAAGPRPSLGDAGQLSQELARIGQAMPPANGQYFFAIGITFTSFKLIDSVALLTVSVGDQVAIEVLGLSTMIAPTPVAGEALVTPLAEVQLAFKASFLPSEGFLGVSAQLTGDSYIFSRACRLTGGCAFYSWFSGDYAGEFVFTLGGYHPRFPIANYPHYPRVPRLGLNWQVNPQLAIKGQGYYALTSAALMAGGQLQITWESGNLKVWFNAGADFLLAWKPYYYDAEAYVQMRVDYTFEFWGTHHISVDVGADLHLWGPEFSGTAHVKLWIVSFDVAFGGAAKLPQPIDWSTFKASFLPYAKRPASAPPLQDSEISACSIAVQDGLVRAVAQTNAPDLWVINPSQCVLVTQSAIPASKAHIQSDLPVGQLYFSGADPQATPNPFRADESQGRLVQALSSTARPIGAVGVGPMAVAASGLSSTHSISITHDGAAVEHKFAYTPVLKSVPAALWGEHLTPDLQAASTITNTLAGFEIRPSAPPLSGASETLAAAHLQTAQTDVPGAFDWALTSATQAQPGDDSARRTSIQAGLTADQTVTARAALLTALGVSSAAIDLSSDVADMFLIAPQIVAA